MLNRNTKEIAQRFSPSHHLLRCCPPRNISNCYSSPLRCLANSLGLPNTNVSLGPSKYQNSYSCSLFFHRCYANLLCIIPVFIYLLLKQVSHWSTNAFYHRVLSPIKTTNHYFLQHTFMKYYSELNDDDLQHRFSFPEYFLHCMTNIHLCSGFFVTSLFNSL